MSAQPTYDDALYDEAVDYTSEPVDLPAEEADALDLANWHLRSIDALRAQRAELVANFEAEHRRLEMRLDSLVSTLNRQEEWHARPLRNLHRAILERDPKRKTINLACGTLKATKQQDEWLYVAPVTSGQYADEMPENTTAFVKWAAEHHPELIAPRRLVLTVPADSVTPVLEALMALEDVPGDALDVSEPAPNKNAVKQTLVKKDEKGTVLVAGVDPETSERPPGLIVRAREPKFEVITDPDA